MVTDRVALAFAKWLEAHKLHVEAEKRLFQAEKVSRQFGGLPPEALVKEVRFLKAEANRLLEIANAEVRAKKP